MIAVRKLDGASMFLNEDLIEHVEDVSDGRSAIYLRDGNHYIVANTADEVVSLVRDEKVVLWHRAFSGATAGFPAVTSITRGRLS